MKLFFFWLVVNVHFRSDFIVPFRGTAVDGIRSSSSTGSATRCRPTTFSSSEVRIRITPWVLRPTMLISETRVRTSVPASVIIMIWSQSSTCTAPTTKPLRSVTLMEITPFVARDLVGVFRHCGTFTITVLRCGEDCAIATRHDQRDDFIAFA